jgi:ribonucleotide reductase beta subunit family protein with ferritin-like domain
MIIDPQNIINIKKNMDLALIEVTIEDEADKIKEKLIENSIIEKISRAPIVQPTDTLKVEYPEAIDFADKQWSVFWPHTEVKVEKDIQDLRVNMTEAERHGCITTLKLFTLYELKAGSEYWGGRFKDRFQRHEFQRMASVFAAFELAVHKPFYAKINEALFLDNDDFYKSYESDPILKSRMNFIDSIIDSPNDLLSLAGFALVEGGILYTNFGYLKHFQAQGKNKILNTVRGINFSVRDENLHSMAGAWTFRKLLSQSGLDEEEKAYLINKIYEAARALYEHECHIADMIFSKGSIEGITAIQLKHFAMSRINNVLAELGLPKLEEVKYNPIADWFYTSITSFSFNDTFSGVGNSYHRNWDETAFVWKITKS